MFKAFIQTETAFGTKTFRVFPKSKKVNTFKTVEAAFARLEALKLAGRGFVFPMNERFTIAASRTIAL